MDTTEPALRRKIRPWFWCVLFLPVLFALVVNWCIASQTRGEDGLGWMVAANLLVGPALNGLCSACCSVHVARVYTGRAQAGWIIGWGLGFFALNLALSFGGCALGAVLGEKAH